VSELPDPQMGYRRRIEDVVAELATDVRLGLSDGEARSRLERHGRNELTAEKPVPAWRRFLAQFQDVLVIHWVYCATVASSVLWVKRRTGASAKWLPVPRGRHPHR